MPTTRTRKAAPPPPEIVTSAPLADRLEIPVMRGIQSGNEYYVAMLSFGQLKKMISLDPELAEVPVQDRSQRDLNPSRVKKIAQYILSAFVKEKKFLRPKSGVNYVFSAVVMSIDPPDDDNCLEFRSAPGDDRNNWGTLVTSKNSVFRILDGQHRTFGSLAALREAPDLEHETLTVIFFLDLGKTWREQAFSDLNRLGVNISKSLKLLFNHSDPDSAIVNGVVSGVSLFDRYTDRGRSSLGQKSARMFTLNGIHDGTKRLLAHQMGLSAQEKTQLAIRFWNAVARNMTEWQQVRDQVVASSEIREISISSHAVTIVAIGKMGASLLNHEDWEARLEGLQHIDWQKINPEWDGTVMLGGKVNKKAENWLHEHLERTLGANYAEENHG